MRPKAAGSAPSSPATNGRRADPASHAPTPPRFPSASRIATTPATGASHGAPSRCVSAAVACGTPFVMLTVSAGRATSIAAVPRTYIATMPKPEMTMPRRSVAAATWISSPSVGASSSPANANVMVANRLIDGRPSFAGTSPRSANGVALRGLVPAKLGLPSINLFATMTFAFAGLELAPTLGDEIHVAAATLRRGIVISGFGIVAMYVLGTAAMLVALPAETVSITNGVPQATAALTQRLGAPWLAPVAGVVAILLALGNLGGVGAWLAGSARLPFVAGLDGALPAAFGRIHPRWHTPHLA